MLFFSLDFPWFPILGLLSRFVEEGRVVFGWCVEFTFPWTPCPCGVDGAGITPAVCAGGSAERWSL